MCKNNEKISIRFLGLVIERKTNFLAFAAFLISLGSLATQFTLFLKGPNIKLIPPKQVFIKCERYSKKEQYVVLSAIMSYVNKGHYNDIIREELVNMKIGNNEYELRFQSFIKSSFKEGKLEISDKDTTLPVPVIARNVETHETYFAPFEPRERGVSRDKNFLAWETFMKSLADVTEIIFTFKSETFEGHKKEASCRVFVRRTLKENLIERGWAAPACFSITD